MFPCGQSSSASPLPHVRGFPALRVLSANPTSTAASAFLRNDPFVRHTRCASAAHQDHSGSLRFLDASFSERAVLSDPAAVSSHLAFDGDLLLPSSHYDSVGLRITYLHEAQSLHLRYGPLVALPTLSSCRYLHEPKARFPVGRLIPLAGAGISPAGSIRLSLTHRSAGRHSRAAARSLTPALSPYR